MIVYDRVMDEGPGEQTACVHMCVFGNLGSGVFTRAFRCVHAGSH